MSPQQRQSRRVPRSRGHGVFRASSLPPNELGIGTADCEFVAWRDAVADRRLLASAASDLDALFVELRSVQLVDDRASVFLEDRFGGHERHGRQPIGGNARRRRHAGTDAWIKFVEHEPEIEVAHRRPARREVDAREHRDQIHSCGKVLAGHRFDLHRCGLSDFETAAIGFIEARLEMNGRQIGKFEDARAGPRAIAFAELDAAAAERPARAWILEDVDRAVGGRDQLQRIDRLLRALDVELRLVAAPPLADQFGFRRRLVGHDLGFDFLETLFGVADRELGVFVFDLRDEIAFAQIEPGALDVVLRLGQLGLPLLGGDLLLRQDLLDLPFRGFQLGSALHQALVERRRVELDDHVPLLDGRAVLDQLHDLHFAAGLQRRRHHDRLGRTNVSANLDVVDEVALGHGGRRDVRHRGGTRVHRNAGGGHQRDDADRGEQAALAQERHFTPAALRATVTPSCRPEVTTASCVFIEPTDTSCRSRRPPRCTRTNACSPSNTMASRGTTSAPGTRSSSTSSDAVRSGIRFGCAPLTSTRTMKLRTLGESVDCWPMGDTWSMAPSKESSGYASRPTRTFSPTRSSFMSAWLTRARTRITAGLTTSITGWPGRTSSPSMNSTMLPPFLNVVLMTATPGSGEVINMRSALDSACFMLVSARLRRMSRILMSAAAARRLSS